MKTFTSTLFLFALVKAEHDTHHRTLEEICDDGLAKQPAGYLGCHEECKKYTHCFYDEGKEVEGVDCKNVPGPCEILPILGLPMVQEVCTEEHMLENGIDVCLAICNDHWCCFNGDKADASIKYCDHNFSPEHCNEMAICENLQDFSDDDGDDPAGGSGQYTDESRQMA